MDVKSEQSTVDLREKLLSYWRRRRVFYAVSGLVAAGTVALALLLPPTYRSSATILIEQQEIPQDLVRSVITSFADQRVQVISQRVMTTQNLLSAHRTLQSVSGHPAEGAARGAPAEDARGHRHAHDQRGRDRSAQRPADPGDDRLLGVLPKPLSGHAR